MKNLNRLIVILLACSVPTTAHAGDDLEALEELSLEDLLALRIPSMVSVLGSHVHNKGEWMTMIMHRRMNMSGLRDGSSEIDTADVLMSGGGTYMAAPLEMRMSMTMFGVMGGVTDRLTFSGMIPWVDKEMHNQTSPGGTFVTKSKGPGDMRLGVDYVFDEAEDDVWLLNMAMTVPTGSTNARGDMPAGLDMRLPYAMQLGSGTFDLKPGVTWQRQRDNWGVGAHAGGTFRLGRGDNGYSLGDRLEGGAWVHHMLGDSLAARLRLDFRHWLDIDGQDPEVSTTMSPNGDPTKQGGKRVDLTVGLGTLLSGNKGTWTLDVEYGVPLYENLSGPQMSTESWLGIYFSWIF